MDPVISKEILNVFNMVVYYSVRPTLLVTGMVTCSISAIVFYKMGLNDSVRMSFFILSIYDLCYLVMSSLSAVCIIWNNGFPEMTSQMYFNPFYVNNFSYWCANIFYHCTLLTTGYISGVRCCCVAIPLKFKNVFTTRRTLFALLVIFIISGSIQVPVMASQYFGFTTDRKKNFTKIIVLPTQEHDNTVLVNDILNRNVLSWLTMFIMTVSLIVMSIKLRSAARFRYMASSAAHNVNTNQTSQTVAKQNTNISLHNLTEHKIIEANLKNVSLSSIADPTNKISKNSDRKNKKEHVQLAKDGGFKEVHVIKSVSFITGLFLILALPFMVYSLVRRLWPQFNSGEAYSNLFSVVTSLSTVCAYINSSFNFFIFYAFNAKFRTTLYNSIGQFRSSK